MFRSFAQPIAARAGKHRWLGPTLEALEDRVVPSALSDGPLAFADVRLMNASLAQGSYPIKSAASLTPSGGYSPAQVAQAYGFNQITFGSVKGDGTGQTIAIVGPYDDPNIASDLATFDSTLGIPAPPSFKKVNQNGGRSYPSADSGWALETSLDVEWAHGIAPGANILLVEANSNSFNDLLAAIDYARNQPGVSVLSMSWGASDFSVEANYDSHFTTPSGHAGVTFVASSGDGGSSGAPVYPSVSPHVLAVGGTELQTDSSGNYQSETGWTYSGGGISAYEAQPGYQNGVVTQSSTLRTTPDVASNAGIAMGIYDTYGYSGWVNVGGTSAAAPQWAALIAIADQGRAVAGQSSLDGFSQTLPKLYQLQSDFHDITSGSNGAYSAGPGYDLVTGLGSPYANLIASALIDAPSNSSGPSVATPASATPNPVTGTTTSLNVLGSDPAGESTLTYTWTVVSEPAGAMAPTYSANGTNAAKNTIVTFHEAGIYTFQVAIRDTSGLTTTSSAGVTVNQTLTSIRVSPVACTLVVGNLQQFTATTLDQFGQAMATQPSSLSYSWTLGTGSVGILSTTGLYQATSTGAATVIASYTMLSGSATVTMTAQATIPAAPANLIVSTVSKTQINLSWSESSTNATGYNIQRSSNGGKSWTQLAQVTTTNYSDTTVSGGKTYQYRVDAYNSAGSSAWTRSGNVVTPKVLLLDSTTSAGMFTTGSGASATITDFFLASPSSGSSGVLSEEPLSLVEQPAQPGGPASTGDSAWLIVPAQATNAMDSFGELTTRVTGTGKQG
jgi:hypothetical protein